jgi:coenzyme PQQ precursor peptide PqqA
VRSTPSKEAVMRWETPQATEFRFGMEITLYIARR